MMQLTESIDAQESATQPRTSTNAQESALSPSEHLVIACMPQLLDARQECGSKALDASNNRGHVVTHETLPKYPTRNRKPPARFFMER